MEAELRLEGKPDCGVTHKLSCILRLNPERDSLSHKINTFFYGATAPIGLGPPHYRGFAITLRHTTLVRNPSDEWSPRLSERYLAKHNTHKRETPAAEFEPAFPANERPQTHALDRAVIGTGTRVIRRGRTFEIFANQWIGGAVLSP